MLFVIIISLSIWLYLFFFRGNFWRANQKIEVQKSKLEFFPSMTIIIPARNEADVLPESLPSLFKQNYSGDLQIILIDDRSEDNTSEVARKIAEDLIIIPGEPLPDGWSGKLWAMDQGVKCYANTNYFLFTDADIKHSLSNLSELIIKAETEDLDLVSLMVLLRCESFWEQLLIPAFVFFFQKLYPFSWVNNPVKKTSAAAGGCILIKREMLEKIGGLIVLKNALIDDCTLAQKVKEKQGRIWLGLTDSTISLRAYNSLQSIWDMVARTAYTQLNYSPWLLLGTLVGMCLVYLLAPMGLLWGLFTANWLLIVLSFSILLLMAIAFFPTLNLYKLPFYQGFSLPLVALLYTLMTLDSAWRYFQGKGGAWKGRVYNS